MAGLGIQQSMNSLIETGTNSVAAHELFMSRFKEYYNTIAAYNEQIGDRTGTHQEVKKVKSIKDRLNATTNVAEHQQTLQTAMQQKKNYEQQKMTSDQASAKAESAVQEKLKAKIKARAKRPQVAEESQPLQAQPRKGINIGK